MLKSKRGKAAEIVVCERCGTEFLKETCNIRHAKHHYCSVICKSNTVSTKEFPCSECGTTVIKQAHIVARYPNGRHFCCLSHAASFNNRLREKTRRSKIEAVFFDRLVATFPEIEMIPNDKTILPGTEVDVAIPKLRLAIEWNGIVHLQPIYGQEKLELIQRRDAKKSQMAADLDIRLIVISDTDSKKKTLNRAYAEVCSIISSLVRLAGPDPATSTPPELCSTN